MLLPIHPKIPQPRLVQRVVEELQRGALIVYPTDTVYGLGCDILAKKAIERIYLVKRLDKAKSLSFLCSDLSHISEYARVSDFAYRVMKHLIPGPYTFVLPATRQVPKMLESKRKTVGIRVPDHPITQAVIRELGRPIVTTSVNPEGSEVMLNDPMEIEEFFGNQLDLVIDAGPGGLVSSTILDLTGPQTVIIRQGKGPTDHLIA